MNFFQAQDKARSNTVKLIILFSIAVLCIILLTNVLLLTIIAYSQSTETAHSATGLGYYFEWDLFFATAAGVSLLILMGSFFKIQSLSKGGSVVAEMLGGQRVPQSTNDADERKLLNVVEEMAIASGMPIPQVYLLDESAINAFAAGTAPATAVIGVTRGAISLLTRDELQGVIAHEFSHIFNGDMRLNIRLIGVLHGILLIGIIGHTITRSLRYTRHSRNSKGGGAIAAVFVLGAGLMVIGYTGTFFGKLIKAVVSRQREYLADASAVQFTRNKQSIAGALKKIGGLSGGSYLNAPGAEEYSHAYFANGLNGFWQSLVATHPPLDKRIQQIDASWDGKYIIPQRSQVSAAAEAEVGALAGEPTTAKNPLMDVMIPAIILSSAEQAISQVGTLNESNLEYVQQLIAALPNALRSASQDAYSARAVVYVLLIRYQKNKPQAWSLLNEHADTGMPELSKALFTHVADLDEKFKLPLLELAINALRDLSAVQYAQFKQTINKIIADDGKVDLNEWLIQRFVLQQLDENFLLRKPAKAKLSGLGSVRAEAEIIWSLIAYVEHKDDSEARTAFDKAKKDIGATSLNIIPRESLSLKELNNALDKLMQTKPLLKPRILKCCAGIILHDSEASVKGIELLRMISSCLDCPMPPLHGLK